ncbi:MAG TPA: ATP-binding protein, partial [Ktedonobacterales bacterium]|nr:ATP-binding protein [Ktedonobacterales bacterium]
WGIVGGVPSYLHALQGDALPTAVKEHILDKSAVLYREAEALLSQEVRGIGPALLHGMLRAIAYGANEPHEIGQRVNRPVTALSGALSFLVDYGLLERRTPYTTPNPERTRKTRYYIADNYLSFWFRFVLPNRSSLEQGQVDYVWEAKIAPQLSTYMGARFEELCRQYIRLHPERWAHRIGELGVWWRGADEIDIVGHDAGTAVLVAEAKWTNTPANLDVLHTLQRRTAMLPHVAPDHQLALFSRSGFTVEVDAARTPYLALLTLDDLLP